MVQKRNYNAQSSSPKNTPKNTYGTNIQAEINTESRISFKDHRWLYKRRQLYDDLVKEHERLEFLLKYLQNKLVNAPEGKLRISQHKSKWPQYYYRDKEIQEKGIQQNRSDERYLKKQERQLAYQVAQREYEQKLLVRTQKEYKAIKSMLIKYQPDKMVDIYSDLHDARKAITISHTFAMKDYIDKWMGEDFERKPFAEGVPEIYTNRGERVRSKSEKIIADALERRQIPYKYECPIRLDGLGTIHPDFTVLNKRTGEIIYWEHLGMIDNTEYSEKACERIILYERNGIMIGRQLVLTFETAKKPLDINHLNKVISYYLM